MKDVGRRSTAVGYALLAPSLFGVVAFLLLPILVVVWLSLHRWNLLGPIEYVGGENWRSVLSDSAFGNSLLVTLTFVAIVVPIQTVLGLAVAGGGCGCRVEQRRIRRAVLPRRHTGHPRRDPLRSTHRRRHVLAAVLA